MSVDLVVQRGAGDRQGPDVVSPLVCDIATALQKGRNLLDERAEKLQPVRYQIVYTPGLVLGQLVSVEDIFQSRFVRGKLVSISHEIGSGTAITEIEVEAVQVF